MSGVIISFFKYKKHSAELNQSRSRPFKCLGVKLFVSFVCLNNFELFATLFTLWYDATNEIDAVTWSPDTSNLFEKIYS